MPSSLLESEAIYGKSSNNCCAMGLGTLTRGRSCATSRRSHKTWQCGFVGRIWVLLGVERSGDKSTILRPSVSERKQKTDLQCIDSKTGCGALVGARCPLRAPTRCEPATACHGSCGELPVQAAVARERSAEMDSSARRTVAAEIAAGNFDASSAVGKLKALFGPKIEHARCTGELCPVLFQLICDTGSV